MRLTKQGKYVILRNFLLILATLSLVQCSNGSGKSGSSARIHKVDLSVTLHPDAFKAQVSFTPNSPTHSYRLLRSTNADCIAETFDLCANGYEFDVATVPEGEFVLEDDLILNADYYYQLIVFDGNTQVIYRRSATLDKNTIQSHIAGLHTLEVQPKTYQFKTETSINVEISIYVLPGLSYRVFRSTDADCMIETFNLCANGNEFDITAKLEDELILENDLTLSVDYYYQLIVFGDNKQVLYSRRATLDNSAVQSHIANSVALEVQPKTDQLKAEISINVPPGLSYRVFRSTDADCIVEKFTLCANGYEFGVAATSEGWSVLEDELALNADYYYQLVILGSEKQLLPRRTTSSLAASSISNHMRSLFKLNTEYIETNNRLQLAANSKEASITLSLVRTSDSNCKTTDCADYLDIDLNSASDTYSQDYVYFLTATKGGLSQQKKYKHGFSFVEKLRHTLSEHTDRVEVMALSPNGTMLVSVSSDGIVKLWDPDAGGSIRTFQHPGDPTRIHAIALSSNSSMIASSVNNVREGSHSILLNGPNLILWNPVTVKVTHTLPHSQKVTSIAFSSDDTILASAGEDGAIKLWHPDTGNTLYTLSHSQSHGVTSIAFSPDDTMLASAGKDNTIKLWDLKTGRLLHTLSSHSNNVLSVVFSSDGTMLASGSQDKSVILWNLDDTTESTVGSIIRTLSGHSNSVLSVAFSPDGALLASGEYNSLKLWNTHNGDLIFEDSQLSESSIVFPLDGAMLASVDWSDIKLWSMGSGFHEIK